jgi:Carboxypeptidase regulatory-like domain
MRRSLIKLLAITSFLTLNSFLAFGQGTTATLSGTVSDASGAVLSGAVVVVKHNATGAEFKVNTSNNGTYTIPSLGSGTYTLTIDAPGFKKAVVQEVKIDAGVPATANVMMEIGAASESIVVQGGAEVLQTQSANVATTITGRQITELPFSSRDALDLVLLLPGTTTPGRPRTSTVNGLPKGALNITTDGVNVQDNTLKSSDGFFTYIRPRIDAIEEVTLSTATPGSESAGEGAVQIKFVTRQGNNEFHGTLYEYHRNPSLNSNYWFNNRDRATIHEDTKLTCDTPQQPFVQGKCRAPRDRVLLNQYGGSLGGPISIPKLFSGRDRAFFFVNYEEYRLPEQVTRNRTILSPLAQQGVFQYSGSSGVRQVNLLNLVGCSTCTSTPDPTVQKLLADIRNSTNTTGAIQQLADPNFQRFTFTNTGGQDRYFPTLRLDFNLTEKHHLENIWNYNKFGGVVDFLNNRDPQFPGFPNKASQISNRFSNVTALRSTFTSRIVNEARFGFTGGTILFFPEPTPADFNGPVANQQGFALNLNVGAGDTALGLTNAHNTTAPSRRNAPVWQFSDTMTLTRTSHNVSFGFNFTQVNFFSVDQTLVPSINFGLDSADTGSALFSGDNRSINFPGIGDADLARAQNIYALLTGRVTAINANARLSEDNGQYNFLGPLIQRARQREIGFFVQDSWRARQNLTLTGGVRLEVQYPFTPKNDVYAQTTFAELYGVSGQGNLFQPGNLAASQAQYTQYTGGTPAYDTDYTNFAPSLGFAWTPNFKGGFLGRLFGEGGQTVMRGGYSVAYNREGLNTFTSIYGGNPGGTIDVNRNLNLNNLGTLPLLLRDGSRLGSPAFQNTPTFPNTGLITDSVNAFNPNLQLGYIQSWSFGVQREIDRDTVIEARYVGTRGVKLWQQFNLNETNIIENKFINEFMLAQANLQANIAAGRGSNFRFAGPGTGTSPLPIILRHFNPTGNPNLSSAYGSANFAAAAFVNTLASKAPAPITFANTLLNTGGLRNNALNPNGFGPALPANFFVVNPNKLGGAFTIENNGRTYYDAAVLELRRRLSKGLLVQGSYTFSRSTTNIPVSSAVVFYQPRSLRNINGDKTLSPFGVTHGFKANWIYELPIGRGKALAGNVGGALDRVIGGWEFHGTARIQSGSPNDFGNVQLVGMTRNQLQDALKIRQGVVVDANGAPVLTNGRQTGATYYLPQDIVENTIRAANVSATSATGYSSRGVPTGRYIAPANSGGCIEQFTAQCGSNHLILYGPSFTRFDLSAIKRVKITERVNFEFRAEFLNAFNNVNFLIGSAANDVTGITNFSSADFGRTLNAYQDTSTTNDPGGRLIQLVGRINF